MAWRTKNKGAVLVKLTKIYTRTGDDGTTGLVDGSRVDKHDARLQAIGDVDEANSALGVAIVALGGELAAALTRIQNDLFDLGADLATPGEDFTPSEMSLRIVPAQVVRLEREIDAMNAGMAPLTSFILPGGAALGPRDYPTRRAVGSRGRRAQPAGACLSQPAVRFSVRRRAACEPTWIRRRSVAARGDTLT